MSKLINLDTLAKAGKIVFVLLTVTLFSVSCSKPNKQNPMKKAPAASAEAPVFPIVGKWAVTTEWLSDYEPFTKSKVFTFDNNGLLLIEITDEVFEATKNVYHESGTYTTKGNQITISISGREKIEAIFDSSEKTLDIYSTDGFPDSDGYISFVRVE